MELRPYAPPTFWTPQGAWAKRRQLERKGFPTDLRDWRFITLTLDPKDYEDPCIAWLLGKRHLREFIYRLKKEYKFTRWCWKLEFHEADELGRIYPHWHLLIEHKTKIDKDRISELWGKGRTNIKRVDKQDFDYLFKYATKAIESIPDWILSRTNVRLFQTSKGFFPPAPIPADDVEKQNNEIASPRDGEDGPVPETQNYDRHFETIGERLKRWSRYVVSRSTSPEGHVTHQMFEMLCDSWGQLLVRIGRIKISSRISCLDLTVRENCIQTSCLNYLSAYLPASI
ncbi:MAG: hypothetical protein WC661_07120 [Opitutaceae bacterium]|jgi:hypothetical protein